MEAPLLCLKERPDLDDPSLVEGFLSRSNEGERGRLVELSSRLRPAEGAASLLFIAAALIGAPSFGWLPLGPPLFTLLAFWLIQLRLHRVQRPEQVLFASVVAIETALGVSFVLAHGPRLFLLPVMIVPALLASVVFPPRMAVCAVAFTAFVMVGVALGFDLPKVSGHPFRLLYPLEALLCGSGIATVVASLELATRGSAIVDPLTGLPNRLALQARVRELEHQAKRTRRPVALLVGDPDRFKAINDRYGHQVGDAVLRELGARIKTASAGVANAYRLGGEEFVLVIGDTDRGRAAELAERIRKLVCARAIEGLRVAISFGVAVSTAEEPFRFDELFGKADRALYEAKRSGGNLVRIWPLVAERGPLPEQKRRREEAMAELASQFERRQPAEVPSTERFAAWQQAHHAATGSWLVQDDVERAQLLELNRLLRERAKPAFAIGFALGGASAVVYGWQILILPPLLTVVYIVTEHSLERLRRPELALGLAWLGLQGSFFVSALIANHTMVAAGPLLFLLLVGSSAVFPPRGVVIGISYTALLMFLTAFLTAHQLLTHVPGIFAYELAIVATIGLIGIAVGRSTINYRGLKVLDQLTGLFTRAALRARVAELEQRNDRKLSLLVFDIDHFKLINDTHGHGVGDAVLAELGYRVRHNLRAFESAYRIGGEEFVVVLEHVELEEACGVALRLAQGIAAAPLAGLTVTACFGVASHEQPTTLRYDDLFRAADQALYAAKKAGPNRIFRHTGAGRVAEVSQPPAPVAAPQPVAQEQLD